MYLVAISFAWVLGIIFASIFSMPLPLILTGFLPVPLMFIFKNRIKILVLTGLCLFSFFGAAFYYPIAHSYNQQAELISGSVVIQIKGSVDSQPEAKDKYSHIRLSVNEVKAGADWQTSSGNILLLVPRFPEYKYGDKLEVRGLLENPPVFEDFDYQAYLAGKDIYFMMYFPQVEIIDRASGINILGWIYSFRNNLAQSLSAALPEPQASLAQGIVLGIRSSIPDSLKTNLSVTGTAHLLAISGVNLTIIAGLLVALGIWLFGRRRYLYVWLTLFIIWFYLLLTGVQAPVVRATIMASIFLIAELLGRQKNIFASLFFSAAIMAGVNPEILFDVSFQLTFTAMLGLIFIAPPLRNLSRQIIFQKIGEEGFKVKTLILVTDSLSVSLGAIIAICPIMAFYFGIFSFVGPVATLLITPSLSPIIIFGSITAMVGLASPPLAQGLGWITWLFLSYMLLLVNGFASIPLAAINTGKISANWVYFYYSILTLTILVKANIKKLVKILPMVISTVNNGFNNISAQFVKLQLKLIVIPLLLGAFFSTFSAATLPDENLHVSILDIGEGDSILIQTASQNILIDGGPSPQAVCLGLGSKLPFWSRNFDLVILTHPHSDHLSGLIEVLKRYKVKQILMPDTLSDSPTYKEWLNLIETKQIPFTIARSGQKISLNSYSEIEILNPTDLSISKSENEMENNGIVVRLSRGQISFLFTADIGQPAELNLIQTQANLKSTVLKVAHHGSDSSSTSEFLAVSRPQLAVISVGSDNQFGHPGKQTLNRLKNWVGSENNLYRTDKSGTIEFTTDGKSLWVKTKK
jgi:competence protein ComEC